MILIGTQPCEHYSCYFGVQDGSGRRSALWKLWVGGERKNDVYLASDVAKDVIKASFHESGYWKVSYTKTYAKTLRQFDLIKNVKQHRNHIEINRPQGSMAGERGTWRAMRLYVLYSQLAESQADWPPCTVVVVGSPANPTQVFDLYFTDSTSRFNRHDWPFKASLNADPVAHYCLGSGEMVWVISFPYPGVTEEVERVVKWDQGNPSEAFRLVDGLPKAGIRGDRIWIPGKNPGGWLTFIDALT